MQNHLDLLKATRKNILKQLDGLSVSQLNTIPNGYNNNLIWNAAHVVVTQQLLCYKNAGLAMKLPTEIINAYRKGSKPEKQVTQAEVDQIKEWLIQSVDWLAEDLAVAKFSSYNEYPTSYGYPLATLEDAIVFNNVHEGMHLGYIIALKKHLSITG